MGIKQNNPGCGCCFDGCVGDCLDGGGSTTTQNVSRIDAVIDGLVDTLSGADNGTSFIEINGIQNFHGTYSVTPNASCAGISTTALSTSGFSATLYAKTECGPGPYSGTSLTVTYVEVLVSWDGTTSNTFSTTIAGFVVRFTIVTNLGSGRAVIFDMMADGSGLKCVGGDLKMFMYQDPNPCQGFNNALTSTSTYELFS